MNALTLLVHGESGMGKSWLGDSAPEPRLILDAEGGTRFTPSDKVVWDPQAQEPPNVESGSVVAYVRDFETMSRVYQWLNSGRHPFRSVVLDSLTEIQKRCLDNIVGVDAPRTQDWGALLRQMEGLVRQFRDLTFHPIKPIECVVFLTTTKIDQMGTKRPYIQGQLAITLPQFVDVVGHLYVQADEGGHLQRKLLTQPYEGYVAKDRTDRLPPVVEAPSVGMIMEAIYGTN